MDRQQLVKAKEIGMELLRGPDVGSSVTTKLLSQASWGRLEMKPKRHKGYDSDTLIASLQALLFKANFSEIS